MREESGRIGQSGLLAAVEQASDSIVITGTDGEIQYVNPAFTAMTGYTRGEAVGKNPRILKSGRQSAAFYEELWSTLCSGRSWHGELINRRKDGSLYTEEMRIAPVHGADGEIVNYIAIKQDVTERRAAREAQNFLAAIVESSPNSIFAYTPAGIILTWNRGAELVYGYSAEQVIGKHVSILVPPDRLHDMTHCTEAILQSHIVSEFGSQGLRKDGRRIHVSVSAYPIKNPAGEVECISIILRDVSERQEAERNRALLASIVECSKDAIIASNPEGVIIAWNRGAEVTFGYSAERAIGMQTSVLMAPGRLADLAYFLGQVSQGVTVSQFESRCMRQDGSEFPVSVTGSPILNSTNEVVTLSAVLSDISERKRTEEALRESEERFHVMADGCPAAMWVTNAQGGVQFTNRAYQEFCGKTHEEIEGNKWQKLIHPEDAPKYVAALRHAVRRQSSFSFEARARRADGKWRWLASYAEPRLSPGGEYLGHVGLSPDITERKRAEQALRSSEERFRQLAENIREVFWMMPATADSILYVSPAYEQVWGRSRDSLYQNPNSWPEAIHPDDQAQARASFARHVRGEAIASEYRIHTPDGKQKWIRDRAFPIHDRAGKLIRIAGIAEDITAQKRYEAELIQAREGADAANRAKSRFLANMSHEIRTPMNGVIGMVQLLCESGLTPEQRGYAEVAQSSGNSLLTLIDDILDLSKIEAGKVSLESSSLSLREIIGGVVELLRIQASAKEIHLHSHLSPEIPPLLLGDPHRLRQVLTNLTGNAIKFTEQGEVSLEASVARRCGRAVTIRFTIADTGIGIPPDRLAAIFSPFTQADDSTTRKYGGTGLGLAITRQLIEMMGGAIGVDSQEGQGSTFYFTAVFELPPGGGQETARQDATGVRLSLPLPEQNARILVAEDNSTNRLVVLAQLQKLGYQADAVTDGAQAIEALERGKYDLVLMDCQMPQMDGFEATRLIRQANRSKLPIIALTAGAMAGDREKCIREGMDDYLSKPVELQQLAEMLTNWLSASDAPSAAQPAESVVRQAAPAVFDPESLLKRFMGDRQFAGTILEGFLDDFPTQLKHLEKHCAEADQPGARLQAHTIKGSAATVSANRLSAVARDMELAAVAGKLDRLGELLPRVAEEFERLKTTLERAGWVPATTKGTTNEDTDC